VDYWKFKNYHLKFVKLKIHESYQIYKIQVGQKITRFVSVRTSSNLHQIW